MAKIYVGNLSYDTTKEDLWSAFEKYGQVEDAFIPVDRESGRARGFGFVTMDESGAKAAIEALDGTEFLGRNIRVNEAQPRGDGGSRGGGGYGGGGGGYGGRGGGGRGGGRGYNSGYDRGYGNSGGYGGGRGGGGYGGGYEGGY